MAASRVACASFNIGANAAITIMRDSSAYTHTITYRFGNATGTIVTKTSQTAIVWNPPAAILYPQIPNAVSGYGTITCKTYDGDTLVGTTTATFYAYAAKEDCIPSLSAAVVDTNTAVTEVTGNSSTLVRYISKPKVTLTTVAKNSATIKSYSINNPVGLIATETPYTFGTVYSDTFRCAVSDSRGYSKQIEYVVANFIEYDPAHFDTVSLARTESTSTTAVFRATGFCFKGSFGSQSNTLTIKYRYKTTGEYSAYTTLSGATWNNDGSFSITANIENLSLDNTYTFEFIAEDKLSSYVNAEVVLSSGDGDLRIAADYIQTKNELRIGDIFNDEWKGVKARRKIDGTPYYVSFGAGRYGDEVTCAIELFKNDVRVARYDLREDGYFYNFFSGLSVAAMAANGENSQGSLILDGGTRIFIQWGRVSITPVDAGVTSNVRIKFDRPFASAPQIYISKLHDISVAMEEGNTTPTADGVNIYIKRADTKTSGIFWLAIGRGEEPLSEQEVLSEI